MNAPFTLTASEREAQERARIEVFRQQVNIWADRVAKRGRNSERCMWLEWNMHKAAIAVFDDGNLGAYFDDLCDELGVDSDGHHLDEGGLPIEGDAECVLLPDGSHLWRAA